jgi:hypothetical protein
MNLCWVVLNRRWDQMQELAVNLSGWVGKAVNSKLIKVRLRCQTKPVDLSHGQDNQSFIVDKEGNGIPDAKVRPYCINVVARWNNAELGGRSGLIEAWNILHMLQLIG